MKNCLVSEKDRYEEVNNLAPILQFHKFPFLPYMSTFHHYFPFPFPSLHCRYFFFFPTFLPFPLPTFPAPSPISFPQYLSHSLPTYPLSYLPIHFPSYLFSSLPVHFPPYRPFPFTFLFSPFHFLSPFPSLPLLYALWFEPLPVWGGGEFLTPLILHFKENHFPVSNNLKNFKILYTEEIPVWLFVYQSQILNPLIDLPQILTGKTR